MDGQERKLASIMHAKTRESRTGRCHRQSRHHPQAPPRGHRGSTQAPSLATLAFLAALVTDVVGVGALPANPSANTTSSAKSGDLTPTSTPPADVQAPIQFLKSCASVVANVDGNYESGDSDDDDCEEAYGVEEQEQEDAAEALLFVKEAVSDSVADFLCPGFSRLSDTHQKPVDPSITPSLHPSPSSSPPANRPWPHSASTHKPTSPPTSPLLATPDHASRISRRSVPLDCLKKYQTNPKHAQRGIHHGNDGDKNTRNRLSASPRKRDSASALEFADPRPQPRRRLHSRSSSLVGRRQLAPRDVPTIELGNIPDRYELGPDGLWYKVTVTTTCPGCHRAANPPNIDDSASNGTVDHDASGDIGGPGPPTESGAPGIDLDNGTGPHDLSAQPSGSASVKTPPGWGDRQKGELYKVPLIVISSVLLAAAIISLIFTVMYWRRGKRKQAKAMKKADMEKKVSMEDSDDEDDEDRGVGEGAGRASGGVRRRRRSSRRTASTTTLRDRDVSASASGVLLTEEDEGRKQMLWAKASARWKAHVRWIRRRKTGKRSILQRSREAEGVSVGTGDEDEHNATRVEENVVGRSSLREDSSSLHDDERGRRVSLTMSGSGLQNSQRERSRSSGSTSLQSHGGLPAAVATTQPSEPSNSASSSQPTFSESNDQVPSTPPPPATPTHLPTPSIVFSPAEDLPVPAGCVRCDCCGAVAGSSRFVSTSGVVEQGVVQDQIDTPHHRDVISEQVDVASPPAYRRRQRRRSRTPSDPARESGSSESEDDASIRGGVGGHDQRLRICTACTEDTRRHRRRHRDGWTDSKRPMETGRGTSPSDDGAQGEQSQTPAYQSYSDDTTGSTTSRHHRRTVVPVLHVAVDDKRALAEMAQFASEPDGGGGDEMEGTGHGEEVGTGIGTGTNRAGIAPSVPEWKDEDVEDVEEFIRREGGGASASGSGGTAPSSLSLLPPPPPPLSTSVDPTVGDSFASTSYALPPPPAPISLSVTDFDTDTSSSPHRTRTLSLLIPSQPQHQHQITSSSLTLSPSSPAYHHLHRPSSPYSAYSAEAEEIVRMEGELGPSAPPFSAFGEFLPGDLEDECGSLAAAVVPSAPPLFEEVDMDMPTASAPHPPSAPPLQEGEEPREND